MTKLSHFENDVHSQTHSADKPHRELKSAMWKGFMHSCPKCGNGPLYKSYLKTVDQCGACDEELHHHRADDAPAYFTISIVGKLIVGFFLTVELTYAPPYWVHAVLWGPLLLIMTLLLLPRIKGIIVGLQWANYMHGFDPNFTEGDDIEIAPADKLLAQNPS